MLLISPDPKVITLSFPCNPKSAVVFAIMNGGSTYV